MVQVRLLPAELFDLESGELTQRHPEDRLRLVLAQEVSVHEARLGFVRVSRPSDQPDHFVEVVDRRDEALHDVQPFARLPEVELRPPSDHDDSVVDERLHRFLQGQDLRLSVQEGEVDHAEGRLHLGVVVQLVQHDVFHGVALQLQDDPHPFPVAFVAEVRNAVDPFRLDEQRDRFDEGGFADHVRDFRDHDSHSVVARLLVVGPRANPDESAAVSIRVCDPLGSVQDPAGREVRSSDRPCLRIVEVDEPRVRVVDQDDERVDDFT